MKKQTLIIIFTLLVQFTFAQNDSLQKDDLLFKKAFILRQLARGDEELDYSLIPEDTINVLKAFALQPKEIILKKSLAYYQELIDNFPKSNLLYRALNNKGFIELELKNNDQAKKTFLTILNSNADDKEIGGIGSGLMAEPYTNYKNRTAKILAEICIDENHFKKAIKYLELTKKFPYRHFCGNEKAADEIYMKELYAKCYFGLKENKKALDILLPSMFDNMWADNAELIDITVEALLKNYTKQELKRLFEQSFKNYKTEKVKSENYEYETCFIIFLDTKIDLNVWLDEDEPQDEKDKEIQRIMHESRFYTLLNE